MGAVVWLGVSAAVVVLCAEVAARVVVRQQLTSRCEGALRSRPVVALAPCPVLLQLGRRRFARVDIDTVDGAVPPDAVQVHGHVEGLWQVPGGVRFDALTATATLPLKWLRRTVEAAQAGADDNAVVVRSISLMPRRGALSVTIGLPVAFGRGIDVRLAVVVTVENGLLAFRVTDLSIPSGLLAVPVPIAWAVDAWIVQLRPKVIPPALDALTIVAMHWERDAVTVDVSARDATIALD